MSPSTHGFDDIEELNNTSSFRIEPGPVPFDEKHFEYLGSLGRGCFGEVSTVRCKANGRLYAVKKSRHQFKGANDRKDCLREVHVAYYLGLDCPHTVHYHLAWEEAGHLYCLMELCERGSLKGLLLSLNDDQMLSEQQIWEFIIDMVLVRSYL